MKKYLMIVMSLLFLSGCNLIAPQKNADALTQSEATVSPYQSGRVNYDMLFSGIDQGYYESGIYINSGFGISFPFGRDGGFIVTYDVDGMKMRYIDRDGFTNSGYFVFRFTKPADQSIEDAIFNVAQNSSQYPMVDNCVIKHETGSNRYSVELKDSFFSNAGDVQENIMMNTLKEYTKREQEELRKIVENEGTDTPSLIWAKETIANKRRKEFCGERAGVKSHAIKSTAGFTYDPQVSKTTFYYTPIFDDRMPFVPWQVIILPDTTSDK